MKFLHWWSGLLCIDLQFKFQPSVISHSWSQHLGSWGREIMNSMPACVALWNPASTKKQSKANLSNVTLCLSELLPNELLNRYLIICVFSLTGIFYCRLTESEVMLHHSFWFLLYVKSQNWMLPRHYKFNYLFGLRILLYNNPEQSLKISTSVFHNKTLRTLQS